MVPAYYRYASTLILVYSLADDKTVDCLANWCEEARTFCPEILIAIIGERILCNKPFLINL